MARRGHGEGSIYQRSDGRWAASITLEGRKRKTLYGKTRKEVQEKLRVAQNEQKQRLLTLGPQQMLKQYLEYWLEEVHRPTIRVGSYVGYRRVLDNHLIPILGHIQLQKLTPQDVQSLYTQKLKEGLSSRTLRTTHAILHKALDDAVRWKFVAQNMCDLVSPPRLTKHEIQTLTQEQARKLLEVARGHRLEALLTVAVATGMRRGELLGLRWQDIDVANKSLYIRRTVNQYPSFGYVENEPKTARSRRKIILPEFVLDALERHRAHQSVIRLKAGSAWHERGLVFCNTLGDYQNTQYLGMLFRALLKEAGLPRIRFHDLRHSAATLLLSMGVHPKVVQELLGHSNISMTMDTYSHVLPSMQQEAMDKLNDLFQ